MNCILLTFVLLFNAIFVLGKPKSITESFDLLNQIVDYNQVWNYHNTTDITEKDIGLWLGNAVDYCIQLDVLKNDINTPEELYELRDNYAEEIIKNLKIIDNKYKSNNLEPRGCSGWEMIGCISAYGGLFATCAGASVATAGVGLACYTLIGTMTGVCGACIASM